MDNYFVNALLGIWFVNSLLVTMILAHIIANG